MDFLGLERSKGGYENILVITDHFTRLAHAIPTKNQTAYTTAKALYDSFIQYYGFMTKLHSDQGRNFESDVIERVMQDRWCEEESDHPVSPYGKRDDRADSTTPYATCWVLYQKTGRKIGSRMLVLWSTHTTVPDMRVRDIAHIFLFLVDTQDSRLTLFSVSMTTITCQGGILLDM